jgi:plasmid maintenance system antidote protein VapI
VISKKVVTFAKNFRAMYEQYLSMPAVPAGAILKRILGKEGISQKKIAEKSSIYPQRINDLIHGKRRFTPEMSYKLENALGLKERGYFYKIQANNETYIYVDEQERRAKPNLNRLRKAIFWEAPSWDDINWKKHSTWIIQRAFEYGNKADIEEIIRFYGREKVAETLNAIPETDVWKIGDRNENRKKFNI